MAWPVKVFLFFDAEDVRTAHMLGRFKCSRWAKWRYLHVARCYENWIWVSQSSLFKLCWNYLDLNRIFLEFLIHPTCDNKTSWNTFTAGENARHDFNSFSDKHHVKLAFTSMHDLFMRLEIHFVCMGIGFLITRSDKRFGAVRCSNILHISSLLDLRTLWQNELVNYFPPELSCSTEFNDGIPLSCNVFVSCSTIDGESLSEWLEYLLITIPIIDWQATMGWSRDSVKSSTCELLWWFPIIQNSIDADDTVEMLHFEVDCNFGTRNISIQWNLIQTNRSRCHSASAPSL